MLSRSCRGEYWVMCQLGWGRGWEGLAKDMIPGPRPKEEAGVEKKRQVEVDRRPRVDASEGLNIC